MKKSIILLLSVLSLMSCEMYKTKDALIDNKSNQAATLYIQNFKEDDKKIRGTSVTVDAGKAISLPFYNDGEVSLHSIGKNYLKKISNTRYDILNLQPIMFTVYNTTDKQVTLSDRYNLFDTQTINGNETKNNVPIFNPEKIQPFAVTNTDNIELRASIQGKKIIISY